MIDIDVNELLAPASVDAPCGDALDYNLDFLSLEASAQIGGADGAEQPDWLEVERGCLVLARQSKDLRLGALLARAWLDRHGFAGLRAALQLLTGYVAEYWEQIHPRPDEDDAADQTVRISALSNLCDPDGLLAQIRRVPLARSRALGSFSFVEIAAAQRAGGDVDPALVVQAFQEGDPSILQTSFEEIEGCIHSVAALDHALRQKVEAEEAVRFEPILGLLRQIGTALKPYLPRGAAVQEAASEDEKPVGKSTEIRDRTDVVHCLDMLCAWYRVHEPSSPVPGLLGRARRLVAKDFLGLLMDLAPDGAAQFRTIVGEAPGAEG
jgi:type VI secretion system protein ImpA